MHIKKASENYNHPLMNILIFAAHYWPRVGGVEHHVQGLAEGLVKKKQQVTIVTFRHRRWPHTETKNGVHIIRLPCISLLAGLFPIPLPTPKYWMLRNKINETEWDIVNTHTRFNTATLLGSIYASQRGIMHIHTEHGNRHTPQPNPIIRTAAYLYDHTLGRLPFIVADKTVVISKQGKPFAKRLGANNKRITYIPNSIDTKQFRRAPKGYRKQRKISDDKFLITYVGRLVEAKGVQDLIKATAKMKNTVLLIVGSGPDEQQFRRLAQEEGVEAHFTGRKQPHIIRKILSDADAFVNPSYAEGLPTSVLEATSVGIPAIATDVGGTKEILPKKCLYTPGDINALKKRLLSIQKNPRKAQTDADKIRENVREQFDTKTMVQQYYELMKSLNT